jgi:CHAD domain-containing protein
MKRTEVKKRIATKNTENAEIETAIAPNFSLGEYACQMISEHYRGMVKYQKKVLADEDPENLHKMRVASRRLRTALQVFGWAVQLPKAAGVKRISSLAKILGNLRDLDVQLADLQTTYRPQLEVPEQKRLDQVIKTLSKQRERAYEAVEDALEQTRYYKLKTTYEDWLEQPQYTAIAQLPLRPLLPDLLSPLLSQLLLHPGWLVPANHSSLAESQLLHDLRKVCKQVRYQAEFFVPFYGDAFATWIQEVKTLQDNLGLFQDSQVLIALLEKYLPKAAEMPGLQAIVQQTPREVLADWDPIRQHYLDPAFRNHLHQMLLEPLVSGTQLPEAQLPTLTPDSQSASPGSSGTETTLPTATKTTAKTAAKTAAKTTARSIVKKAAKTTPKNQASPP